MQPIVVAIQLVKIHSKPSQGLKQRVDDDYSDRLPVKIHSKPSQGLKRRVFAPMLISVWGQNSLKTLSGIETKAPR